MGLSGIYLMPSFKGIDMKTIRVVVFSLLLAANGLAWGEFELHKGMKAYESGDYSTALREWSPSAEQGLPFQQLMLGNIYNVGGGGVQKDYKEAMKWFHRAAEQNEELAQYSLGLMYYKGHGTSQDYKESAKWFRKAAENENDLAQYMLATLYLAGYGVQMDHKE